MLLLPSIRIPTSIELPPSLQVVSGLRQSVDALISEVRFEVLDGDPQNGGGDGDSGLHSRPR